MAQFARPDADTTLGNFTDQAAGTTDIFGTIDESSPSDADYIQSPTSPSAEVYVCRLSDVTDPVSSSNHVVRFRHSASLEAQETIEIVRELRMTYVNEGSQGTLIESKTVQTSTTTWATDAETLSGAEADAITDYTALFIRFSMSVV